MLVKKSVVLAKVETTPGTDAAPTAALNAVYIENLNFGFANQKMIEQSNVKTTLGKDKSLFGSTLFTASFDVKVKGSGAAGTAPECGPLLQACGFDETVVVSTSVTYAPLSEALKHITLYIYRDGKLYPMLGCQGNVSFNGESGGAGMFSFTFTGHEGAQSDTALPAPTLDATESPIIKSAGFSVDSFAASISKLSFDMGNEVSTPLDVNAADGFGEITIIDRNVTGGIDPLDTLLATNDFVDDWKTSKSMALTTGVIGGTAGNRFQISMPAISYTDAPYGERDGQQTVELVFGAHESAGDDQVSITFT